MRIGMRIGFGIALALLVAGTVYAVTAHEREGAVMLLLCAVAFAYVGLVLRRAVRAPAAHEEDVGPAAPATEEHAAETETVEPSVWPFVFSIAALALVVGVVGARWVLIPGGILFVGAAAGWFRDVGRQRRGGGLAHTGSGSGLERQQ
jgi:Ca2+/Na+ antiporter